MGVCQHRAGRSGPRCRAWGAAWFRIPLHPPFNALSAALLLALGALSAGGCGSKENTINAGTPLCEAGELRCKSTAVEVCRADGDGFELQEVCSGDTPACANGACVATVCEPASVRCEGNTVVTCAADGLAVTRREPCGVNQCVDGRCETRACRPGTHCNGSGQVEVCSEDGFTLIETLNCRAGEVCEGGACKARICVPGATYCQGLERVVCSTNGTSEEEWPCGDRQSCVNGSECAAWACEPGTDYCDGAQPRRCSVDGVNSAPLGAACSDGQSGDPGATCRAGVCEPWVCPAGEAYCDGNQPMDCAGDGLSTSVRGAACSGDLPYCEFARCEGVRYADYDGYARGPLPGTPGHPHSYTVNEADKTVLDNVTGLLWQREPATNELDWTQAVSYCDRLTWGGRKDWRLPTRMELLSLVDYGRVNPAIDSDAFPSTPSAGFWSASGRTDGNKWFVAFSGGFVGASSSGETRRVRCVAEGTSQRPIPASGHFFEVTGDTVLDHATGLEWQRSTSPGQQYQVDSVSYCEGLSLGGKTDWRLPTVAELSSLVPGRKAVSPHIDLTLFSGTQSSFYWSASPVSGSSSGWVVSFGDGSTYGAGVAHAVWARCVR
ncbi:MAG: DUF1566 domain-containing protein [Polyangiaceae bacterium]|nr:DUF1566 domain-containing protein [Polyangiaceae bacterium]MCW5792242.1 DUF1566 domain-containing protein [Polyangiaceae bacterium]